MRAVAQVNSAGTGMQPIEGRRIPLVYRDTSGEDYRRFRLSSRPTPVPADTMASVPPFHLKRLGDALQGGCLLAVTSGMAVQP